MRGAKPGWNSPNSSSMHKVVWSDLIYSVCPVVVVVVLFSSLSWSHNPFTPKLHRQNQIARSTAFMITHLPPARQPARVTSKKSCTSPASPPACPETKATNFHSLNPFIAIGTPLPKVGRRSEAVVKQEMQARWHHAANMAAMAGRTDVGVSLFPAACRLRRHGASAPGAL